MKYNNEYKRQDVYERVTGYVIEALQKGHVPWQRKWSVTGSLAGLPRNAITHRPYRGWNMFLLNYVTYCQGYNSPYFLTFKQAAAAGGYIRRGETGTPIIYWAVVDNKKDPPGDDDETGASPRQKMIPKLHVVFNTQQTGGIDFSLPAEPVKTWKEKIIACDHLIEQMPQRPTIKHGGNRAYYHRLEDYVQLPRFSAFDTAEDYYTSCFHELAHSTGHTGRLNRKELMQSKSFGSDLYSKEELTAEMTATYLCAITGIEQQTINNSVSYIQNWLQRLQNDKKLLVHAAAQAQAAADFIIGKQSEQPALPNPAQPYRIPA
ncbi:MAG: DUF1738 domain-containing protein [Chitinophagaceae bacterium]|nr:MAG: DUF1738 domain-containing protein [Chitinophagaceae bacterium]